MRFFVFFLLGILFLSLQTTVFQSFPEWVGVPDLLFLLILFLALYFKPWPGAVLTVLFGFGMEVFSGYFLGLYVMAYLAVFFVVKGLAAHFALDALNHQPPLAALTYLFVNAFVYVSSLMLADGSLYPWGWGLMLQRALIVTILVIPVNRCLSIIAAWCDKRPKQRSLFGQKKGNYYKARG
jgi:rod shape-determining protein MreD